MSTYTELLGTPVLRDTYGVSGIPAPEFRQIAAALKVILAADGAIHPAELNAYLETCRCFGASDDLLVELRDLDPSGMTVADCFAGMDPERIPARSLLYDAIKIAKADGDYARTELRAVRRAAELLGIDEDWLTQITALVNAEDALAQLKLTLLAPTGLPTET